MPCPLLTYMLQTICKTMTRKSNSKTYVYVKVQHWISMNAKIVSKWNVECSFTYYSRLISRCNGLGKGINISKLIVYHYNTHTSKWPISCPKYQIAKSATSIISFLAITLFIVHCKEVCKRWGIVAIYGKWSFMICS